MAPASIVNVASGAMVSSSLTTYIPIGQVVSFVIKAGAVLNESLETVPVGVLVLLTGTKPVKEPLTVTEMALPLSALVRV